MADSQTFDAPSEIGKDPKAVVRRWLLEIKLAEKLQREWSKQGKDILERYRGERAKKNSFNILWANTETLAPAVFNSTPKPDVRQRFSSADPVSLAVAEVLQRALSYSVEAYPFYNQIQLTVLDILLPGRGVDRVKYLPTFRPAATAESGAPNNDTEIAADTSDAAIGDNQANSTDVIESEGGDADSGGAEDTDDLEEVDYETVECEHVQWDDFLHGPGKTWGEVTWVAFKHRMHKDELRKTFGSGTADKIKMDAMTDTEVKDRDADTFKTALVWEIWDKSSRKVLFVAPSLEDMPCKESDDPLDLKDFFPTPRPVYGIDDSTSLIPVPLFAQYKEQADELDRISTRINKIIDAIKVRGIYDSTLQELATLMESGDNDLIPATNAIAFQQMGGLDKAIWFMPFQMAAEVLVTLYKQREACKQVIYEITGISDIVRGSSDAQETATAQQIKSQWGTLRLQKMQRDIQRYIRDLVRIKAEIIGGKFSQETLAKMTQCKYPTAAEQQAARTTVQTLQRIQQAAQQATQSGQLPPQVQQAAAPLMQQGAQAMQQAQTVLQSVSWEQIMAELQSDSMRNFNIDIETDSTVAATISEDMQSLAQLLQAIGQTMQTFAPVVERGMMPADAVKQILLSVCRRAKMGSAVYDEIEEMKAPGPAPDPNAGKNALQQAKDASDAQLAQQKHIAEQQRAAMKEQSAQQLEAVRQQGAMQLAAMERQAKDNNDRLLALLESRTKITVAETAAGAVTDAAQIAAASAAANADAGAMQ